MKKNKSEVDVSNQLGKLKSQSVQIYKEVRSQINKSSIFNKGLSYGNSKLALSPSSLIVRNRSQEVDKLAKNLSQKIKKDHYQRIKFLMEEENQTGRKSELQKKIEQINKRNQLRIKQIQQIQQKQLNRITKQYKKDQEIQRRLKSEFERITREQKKNNAVKIAIQAVQNQDWRNISHQKKKLQKMVDEQNKNKQKVVRQRSVELLKEKTQKRQQKPQKMQLNIVINENKINTKNLNEQIEHLPMAKADAKQMGKRYLQHAKKMQLQQIKQKPKVKLLDINLKSIDYVSDIVNMLARKTGDLSKFVISIRQSNDQSPSKNISQNKDKNQKQQKQKKEQEEEEENLSELFISSRIVEELNPVNSSNFAKDNEEIENYLKKVKENIQQIQDKQKLKITV